MMDEHVRLWRERRMDGIRGGVKSPVKLKTVDDIRGRNRAMATLENIGFLKAKMMDSRGVLR